MAIDNLHRLRQGMPSASKLFQKQIFISGLANRTIRREILSHPDARLPLEETIAFVESKESGARGELNLPAQDVSGAISQHRQAKLTPIWSALREQLQDTKTRFHQSTPEDPDSDNQQSNQHIPESDSCSHCGGKH